MASLIRRLIGRDRAPIQAADATPLTSGVLGGLRNSLSGLGGANDKTAGNYFAATEYYTRNFLERLYRESPMAAKITDLPVNDMFARWRRFTDDNEAAVKAVEDLEARTYMRRALSNAMKLGRVYGTGFLIMRTREAPMDTPLDVTRIREGDLLGFSYLDRFNANVDSFTQDMADPNFPYPEIYTFNSVYLLEQWRVHHSRVLRFDGIEALNSDGWAGYTRYWGGSELARVTADVTNDAADSIAAAQLMQEASIPVVYVTNLSEALVNRQGPDAPDIMTKGTMMSQLKGIFNTMFLDKDNDKFQRVAVSFAGMAEILEKRLDRVAAVSGIPKTRFLSASPAGMNATGESDANNWALSIKERQEWLAMMHLRTLDEVVARSAGLPGALEYEWVPLIDFSEKEQAETAKLQAETWQIMHTMMTMDENEIRAEANGKTVFGELLPLSDLELEERAAPTEAEEAMQNAEIEAMQQRGNQPPAR